MINLSAETPAEVLATVDVARATKRIGENSQLIMATRWTDLYPAESVDSHQLKISGGNRPIQPGGEGTPAFAAFCVQEFGVKLGKSSHAAECYLADALDLRHRLPRLWERVRSFEVDAWQAQYIAQQTRHLTLKQALSIDAAIAEHVGRDAWSQVRRHVDAKIIEVDAENIARQAEARKAELGVWVNQGSEHGTKSVYMRVGAPDAIWFDAMVDRIAVILARRGHKGTRQQRRAAAIGILANPLRAIKMLAEDAEPSLFDPELDEDELSSLYDNAPTDNAEPPANPDPVAFPEPTDEFLPPEPPKPEEDPEAEEISEPAGLPEPVEAPTEDDRPVRFPRIDEDLSLARAAVAAIGKLDPAKLRPDATLYVHIAAETLGQGLGVTRVEDIGTIVSDLVADWLKDCTITVKPVIDLRTELTPVNAYEIPKSMRERVFLRRPTSVFPFSAGRSRRADLDHSDPYREGVPNQTRESNLGPLVRREHNVVTHGDWRRRQPEPGTYLFRAPHGSIYLVNATGTHDLGNSIFASLIWHAATPEPAD